MHGVHHTFDCTVQWVHTTYDSQVPQHTARVLEYCSSLKMAMVCSCNVKVHLKPNIQQLAGNKFAYMTTAQNVYI